MRVMRLQCGLPPLHRAAMAILKLPGPCPVMSGRGGLESHAVTGCRPYQRLAEAACLNALLHDGVFLILGSCNSQLLCKWLTLWLRCCYLGWVIRLIEACCWGCVLAPRDHHSSPATYTRFLVCPTAPAAAVLAALPARFGPPPGGRGDGLWLPLCCAARQLAVPAVARRPHRAAQVCIASCFTIAMHSKPTVVSVPVEHHTIEQD